MGRAQCVWAGAGRRRARLRERAGVRVGPGELLGPRRRNWAAVREAGLGYWVGLGFLLSLFLVFSPLFLFLSSFSNKLKPHSNYLNSNLNLNSTLALKQVRQCTSMNATTQFKLRQILIS